MKSLILALILVVSSVSANAACTGTPLPRTITSSFICKYYVYYYYHVANGKSYKIYPMPKCSSEQYWLVRKPDGSLWQRFYSEWGYYPPDTITDCVGEKLVNNLINKPNLWIRVQ